MVDWMRIYDSGKQGSSESQAAMAFKYAFDESLRVFPIGRRVGLTHLATWLGIRTRQILAAQNDGQTQSENTAKSEADVTSISPQEGMVRDAIMGAARLHTHDHDLALRITRDAMFTINEAASSHSQEQEEGR